MSVGRHYWRCKARISSAIQPFASSDNIITHRSRIITTSQVNNNSVQSPISDNGMIKCVCGRNCKGKKGLRAHSRYCDTAKKLDASYETNNNPPGSFVNYNSIDGESVLRENLNAPNTDVISSSLTNSPDADSSLFQNSDHFKPGLRLPENPEDWLVANAFFHSLFSSYDDHLISVNLDYFVQDIQDKIYNYFKFTFGSIEPIASIYNEKYCDFSVKSLKDTLKKLKGNSSSNIEEIRFVSKLIRSKLNKNKIIEADLEEKLSSKFWSKCQNTFNKATNCIPKFPVTVCQTYFTKILSITGRLSFSIPNWIPQMTQIRQL